MGRTNGIKARVIVIHRRWPRCDGNRRVLRRGGQSPNLLAYRWPTSREETLGIRCGPYRRRAHESRGVRKFAFDWRQGSRGSGHTILVNSRSPEALISHDSAPMRDLRGGTILDYSSLLTDMSNWTCVGHFMSNRQYLWIKILTRPPFRSFRRGVRRVCRSRMLRRHERVRPGAAR
jgi:hypothetical protein